MSEQVTPQRALACFRAFNDPAGRKIATEDIAEGLFWRMYDALNWSCITKERHDEKASLLSSLKVQGPET